MNGQIAEADMLQPVLDWLLRRGSVGSQTAVATELSWSGRRVDLAICNSRGVTSSFELKLRDNSRALSQAMLNALAFDRSYIVTMTMPSQSTLDTAAGAGIGIVLVSDDLAQSTIVLSPQVNRASERVRTRLRVAILARQRKGGLECSGTPSLTF